MNSINNNYIISNSSTDDINTNSYSSSSSSSSSSSINENENENESSSDESTSTTTSNNNNSSRSKSNNHFWTELTEVERKEKYIKYTKFQKSLFIFLIIIISLLIIFIILLLILIRFLVNNNNNKITIPKEINPHIGIKYEYYEYDEKNGEVYEGTLYLNRNEIKDSVEYYDEKKSKTIILYKSVEVENSLLSDGQDGRMYDCTGECVCRIKEERRFAGAATITYAIYYTVSALTIYVAKNLFKEMADDYCSSSEKSLGDVSVECEKKDEVACEKRDEEFQQMICKGRCKPSGYLIMDQTKDEAERVCRGYRVEEVISVISSDNQTPARTFLYAELRPYCKLFTFTYGFDKDGIVDDTTVNLCVADVDTIVCKSSKVDHVGDYF